MSDAHPKRGNTRGKKQKDRQAISTRSMGPVGRRIVHRLRIGGGWVRWFGRRCFVHASRIAKPAACEQARDQRRFAPQSESAIHSLRIQADPGHVRAEVGPFLLPSVPIPHGNRALGQRQTHSARCGSCRLATKVMVRCLSCLARKWRSGCDLGRLFAPSAQQGLNPGNVLSIAFPASHAEAMVH